MSFLILNIDFETLHYQNWFWFLILKRPCYVYKTTRNSPMQTLAHLDYIDFESWFWLVEFSRILIFMFIVIDFSRILILRFFTLLNNLDYEAHPFSSTLISKSCPRQTSGTGVFPIHVEVICAYLGNISLTNLARSPSNINGWNRPILGPHKVDFRGKWL